MDEKLKELINNRIKNLIDELIDYKKGILNGNCPYKIYKKMIIMNVKQIVEIVLIDFLKK